MMFHKAHLSYLLAGLMAAVVSACADDDVDYNISSSNDIKFTASIVDDDSRSSRGCPQDGSWDNSVIPMSVGSSADSMYLHSEILDWSAIDGGREGTSRSNMIGNSGVGMYDKLSVSAYHYTDDWSADKAKYQPNFFYFEGASGSFGSGYSLYTQRYWPSAGKMRFISFTPYDPSNSGSFQMANVDGNTGPYIHIEIDKDVTKHQDLLVSFTEEFDCTGSRSPVNLNFKHALTCVQFVMAEDMDDSRIKSISIKNVKYHGDMHYSDNMTAKDSRSSADVSLNDSYYSWDGTEDFTLDLVDSANPNGLEKSASEVITDSEHSFMMFPQVLPDQAMVEIVLQRKKADGSWGNDEIMFGYIASKRWPAGKIVRYRVSKERWWQELQVSKLPAYPPMGGEQYFSITSFDITDDGKKKGIKWSVKYEDPKNPGTFIDTNPGWYSFDTDNSGDIDPRSIKVTVQPLPVDHTVDLDAKLKSVGTYGTKENPYNLSTKSLGKTSVGTTANCYIVDRPGWYILPLVYGNGIVNGSDNRLSYHPNAGSANGALNNFINHKGEAITSPYILTDCASQKSAVTQSSAKVVWQDKPNLIRNGNMSVDMSAFGGNGGILFQITDADIIQGNSVIGLEVPGQAGKMMWSWHIWVTPFFRSGLDPMITETIGITNNIGKSYDMLYVNLGWCSTSPLEIYNSRTSDVQFTATTDDGRTLTKTMTVIQAPFVRYWHGRNTYYQWGRKDPFQPFEKSWEQTWYDSDGNTRWEYPAHEKFGNLDTGLKERILNPATFHGCDDEWAHLPNGNWEYKPSGFEMYTNLWDATNNSEPFVNLYRPDAIDILTPPDRKNVKSIYDPCPPGFKVPPIGTFTGFTNTGNNIKELVDSPKNWNGLLTQYDFDCGGGITTPSVYLFFTNTDKTSYIAMPLTGYRDWRDEGASYNMGTMGYCWTSGSASDDEGYYLELKRLNDSNADSWIMPLDYYWQLDAMPVRPCRE